MNNISGAKESEYAIELYYIGLESVELAKERVSYRVKQGGHGISEEDIERRYYESLNNLKKIIPLCDKICIYDNSHQFRSVAMFRTGQCVWKDKVIPEWCKDFIQ